VLAEIRRGSKDPVHFLTRLIKKRTSISLVLTDKGELECKLGPDLLWTWETSCVTQKHKRGPIDAYFSHSGAHLPVEAPPAEVSARQSRASPPFDHC